MNGDFQHKLAIFKMAINVLGYTNFAEMAVFTTKWPFLSPFFIHFVHYFGVVGVGHDGAFQHLHLKRPNGLWYTDLQNGHFRHIWSKQFRPNSWDAHGLKVDKNGWKQNILIKAINAFLAMKWLFLEQPCPFIRFSRVFLYF